MRNEAAVQAIQAYIQKLEKTSDKRISEYLNLAAPDLINKSEESPTYIHRNFLN